MPPRCSPILLLALSLPLLTASAANGMTATGWQVWPGASVGVGVSVAAVSESDVWASENEGGAGSVQHWDGASWGDLITPPANGATLINALAAVSSSDVWGAGWQVTYPSQDPQTFIVHYDGTAWTASQTPNPGTQETLTDVSASSATNAWAVGSYFNQAANGGDGAYQALPVRFNGTGWSFHAAANTSPMTEFYGVSTVSATDAWAVGRATTGPDSVAEPLIEHWNGSNWSRSFSPSSGFDQGVLRDVLEISPTNVWAVGTDGNQALVEHWNGAAWARVPMPALSEASSSDLFAISGPSGSNIWVGGTIVGPDVTSTYAAHYDGARWSEISTPNPLGFGPDNRIASLSVVSSTGAFAGGINPMGPYPLRYAPGEFTSSFTAFAPDASPGQLGTPSGFHGQLDFSDHASAWGATIHITRTNPDLGQTQLADVTASDDGRFVFQDTPPNRGTYTYTATYDGDSSRSGASTTTAFTETGVRTTITLRRSARTIKYKGTVTLTAHLAAHASNRGIKILKTGATGVTTVLASGEVNASGTFSARASLTRNTTFHAVYDGDETYEPAKSANVSVHVRVAIIGRQSGFYARSGPYRLYHYKTTCANRLASCPVYTVFVKPNKAGQKVHASLQIRTRRGWTTFGTATLRLGTRSRASVRLRYTNTAIIGRKFREHASYPGDAQNAANTSSWSYFIITR